MEYTWADKPESLACQPRALPAQADFKGKQGFFSIPNVSLQAAGTLSWTNFGFCPSPTTSPTWLVNLRKITEDAQPVQGGQGVFPKCWPGQPSLCEKPCPVQCDMVWVDVPAFIWGLELSSAQDNWTMPMTSYLAVISNTLGTHPYSLVHNFFRAMKTRGFLFIGSFLREPNRWQHYGSRKQRDS